MTLEELDNALTKLHLDLTNPSDLAVRNKILARHGQSILDVKRQKCNDCWLKEHGKCNPGCRLYLKSDDPVEVSKDYLSHPNDISIFPFMYMYMIPVYEEVTGRQDTMEKIGNAFKHQWKKEKGDVKDFPSYI